MASYEELLAEAKRHEDLASELKKQASELCRSELKAKPLAARLVYSAHARCPCGAGLAYDPVFEDENSIYVGPLSGYWDCSAILLGTADQEVQHTEQLPFSFWDIKSENQPSVQGATTRPR